MSTTTQERLPLAGVDESVTWRLDNHTREVGRRGLEQARAALAEAARRVAEREAGGAEHTAARRAA